MKTPMQEHIEWLKEKYRNLVEQGFYGTALEIGHCINHAEAMLEKEKNLLIAYEKQHYTPSEWILASEQCKKEIDEFLND